MSFLVKIGLLGLLAGGTATVVYSEPAGGWLSPNGQNVPAGPPGTSQDPASSTGATGTGATGVGVSAGVTVQLSLPDIQTRVRQLHDQVRADARHIQHLQQIARKEKDVIKLNCVNDKLVQVKPQMNIADLGEAELESAQDAERMGIFDGIVQAAETIRKLREEADQCIGEPIVVGSETSNSFTGPKAPDDPTKGFDGSDDSLEPPGYASPYN